VAQGSKLAVQVEVVARAAEEELLQVARQTPDLAVVLPLMLMGLQADLELS
jgi:hypothetical protein